MYLSLNWLKDLVNIPGNLSPKELGRKLTIHTVEIDSVETQEEKFNQVVIGKVLEVSKHPDADRLKLARVDVGEKEPLDIVCGAPNLEAGLLVPVALIGAELPNGLVVEERSVRGEASRGMICAEDELGLGDDHAGIMILEKNAKIGKPFSDYLKFNDVIFEVDNKSITNRPDLWGHLGMAREIAVFTKAKTTKKFKNISEAIVNSKSEEQLKVSVEDKVLCPRYSAIKIEAVAIKESPKWITDRLTAAGMRPINNIVDATNYVMLELGQPLHAFDANQVESIIVRRAKKGEKMETLDEQERELDNSMLVIADNKNPIAIAGVMGGRLSEVNENTKSIVLESANFEPINIRKTSTKLGLRTESSIRFEKSLDPNMTTIALARCLEIIKETCPKAKFASALFDASSFNLDQGPIKLDLDWLKQKIGQNLEEKMIRETLTSLGFGVKQEDSYLEIEVPSWRATKDVSIAEDIVEEIARIYGYDNLKTSMPLSPMKAPIKNPERILERKIKMILSGGAGMSEIYNYSFISEDKLRKLNIKPTSCLRLANPISNVHTLLKQNLFSNMLDNIRTNQARYDNISLFEIGSIFLGSSGNINKDQSKGDNLPYQEKRIGLIEGSAKKGVYKRIKGKAEYLLDNLGIDIVYESQEMVPDWADKKTYAAIKTVDGLEIGFVSGFENQTLTSLGIKKDVAIVEISLPKLLESVSGLPAVKYQEPYKYPAVQRDLAFVVDAKVLYNDIKKEIEEFDELVSRVELFDVYEGTNLEKGKKSLAFHVDYLSFERTLESAEADALQKKLAKKLEDKFGARVRDF